MIIYLLAFLRCNFFLSRVAQNGFCDIKTISKALSFLNLEVTVIKDSVDKVSRGKPALLIRNRLRVGFNNMTIKFAGINKIGLLINRNNVTS